MAKARMQTPRKAKKHKKQEKIFRSRCTLLDEAQFTTFLYRTDKTEKKRKKNGFKRTFSIAKERKRELCQTRKDQGKERSITLFMRKTCTNERTTEQLTKATEFWQMKTNKNCAKEAKEIPDKSPRE
jgi:hypothetical protein